MSPGMYQVAGAIIVGAVLIQALALLISSLRRAAGESVQQNLALELLKSRVDIAKGVFREIETSAYSWPGFRKFVIQRKVDEGGNVCSFYLSPHDGKPLPAFNPGQYRLVSR